MVSLSRLAGVTMALLLAFASATARASGPLDDAIVALTATGIGQVYPGWVERIGAPITPKTPEWMKWREASTKAFTVTAPVASRLALDQIVLRAKTYDIGASAMMPLLHKQDLVLVIQNAYRSRTPRRGEVVVLSTRAVGATEPTELIRRVIGLPGERIQFRSSRTYIDNELVAFEPLRTVTLTDDQGQDRAYRVGQETLPGGASYEILERTDLGPFDDSPIFRVPPDNYFVLADNREGSIDSRTLPGPVGMVPLDRILHQAVVVVLSGTYERIGKTLQP